MSVVSSWCGGSGGPGETEGCRAATGGLLDWRSSMQLLQPQSRQERERESPSPALTLLQAAPLVLLQRSQHFKQTTQIKTIYFTSPDLIQIVCFIADKKTMERNYYWRTELCSNIIYSYITYVICTLSSKLSQMKILIQWIPNRIFCRYLTSRLSQPCRLKTFQIL